MTISVRDIVPFSTARTHLSELVLEVQNGAEKIITKNGEPAVGVIDAKRLDHYHRLDRAHIHLLLLNEVDRGLADVEAGRTVDALDGLAALKARRKSAVTAPLAEMADPGGFGVPLALVRYSDNFALNLDSIEAFWTENDLREVTTACIFNATRAWGALC